MKLHSFGKLCSLVAVLTLIVALSCAMTLTARAESTDALSSEGELTVTVTAPYKECGKVKLAWDSVNGADKYAVYCNDEHVANSVVAFYSISGLEVAAHGSEEIYHSFKVVAVDSNGNELASGNVTAAAKHNYTTVVTAPTCTEGGFTTHTCACTDMYVDDPVEALGHTPMEAARENVVPPTCVLDGNHDEVVYCAVCHDELSRVNVVDPATGHRPLDPVSENIVDSNCVEDGHYDSVVYCGICFEELERDTIVIPAKGHTNGASHKENELLPNCVEEGYYDLVVRCTVCDEILSSEPVVVPANGHTEGSIVVENIVSPDCVNDGSYDNVVYCVICRAELKRDTVTVDALGHTEGEAVVENTILPDCVNSGSHDTVVYCTTCNAELSRETLTDDATGHKGGAATCTELAVCETCGVAYGEALGHSFNNYRPDGNATCLTDGTKTSKCSRCDVTDTLANTGAALGHSFKNYVSDGNATCFEDGTKTSKCVRCDVTDTQPDVGSTLTHNVQLEDNPEAFVLYRYCTHCGGEKEFGKVQIPVPYRKPLLKGTVVTVCLLVIIFSVKALLAPATTTPFWRRRY